MVGIYYSLAFVVLLATHLLLMQVAAVGPLFAVFLDSWSGSQKDHSATAARLAHHCIWALVTGVLTGLGLAWLATAVGTRDYQGVIDRFYPRIWWGGWELLFGLLVLILYAALWRTPRRSLSSRVLHRLLAIGAATNLIYHFPPLLTVMANYLDKATAAAPTITAITSAEYRQLVFQTAVLGKSLHFVLAGCAVVGAWVMLFAVARPSGKGDVCDKNMSNSAVRMGAWTCVSAMAAQMLTGIWVLIDLPPQEQAQVTSDAVTSGLLIVGIVLSLVALNQASSVGMGEAAPPKPQVAAGFVLLVVLLMAGVVARLGGAI